MGTFYAWEVENIFGDKLQKYFGGESLKLNTEIHRVYYSQFKDKIYLVLEYFLLCKNNFFEILLKNS